MHALKVVIFGVVLVVALTPGAAVAGPLEDGLEAYNSGDYVTARDCGVDGAKAVPEASTQARKA